MIWVNPTGKGMRNDSAGSGAFGAPRGSRKHRGIDLLCEPGQEVLAPLDGIFQRLAFPYSDTQEYSGILLLSQPYEVKLFYLLPFSNLVGAWVSAGTPIGTAQDVTERYPGQGMLPHIHVQVTRGGELIDPQPLFADSTRF